MHHFQYRRGVLHAEAVPVPRIAQAVGTPFYLYSLATLEHHFQAFDGAFGRVPHLTCFALKANPNLALLRAFARLGAGADIVSGGELFRALKAGIPPGKIVYSGVGKTAEEIEFALRKKIFMLNVESPEEMRLIDRLAGRLRKKAPVAIRVNPDIDAKTHPYISTGLKKNKFGINIQESLEEYRLARDLPNLQIKGVDCHIGSQLLLTGPFLEAVEKLKRLVAALEDLGLTISVLDLGGGLGITYDQEEPPHPREYARAIIQALGKETRTIVLEPGRVLVGNAGILVTKVLYIKKRRGKEFHHRGRGDERFASTLPVRLLPRHPVGRQEEGRFDPGRRGGTHLRKRGLPGQGPHPVPAAGRRPPGRHERRGLRLLHVEQLQHPAPGRRGAQPGWRI